jgi:hypothetical protein
MNSSVTFAKTEAKQMAIFISQLIREGVTFTVYNRGREGWEVELTGGY